MHDSIMAQIGTDHEHHNGLENGFADGWADINAAYPSSQNQSPMYEHGGFAFIQQMQQQHHSLPADQSFHPQSQRMSQPPPAQSHQQLLPLIMPSHPTWPSMLTNAGGYSAPPVAIPPASAPVVKGNSARLAANRGTSSPRKTLTDKERRRMCEVHEANPTVKQTEIGAMFGVERSTVSKVLRQREKYLYPEDRTLSPVKRTKGKFPDIEKALSVWVQNNHKKGLSLSDAAITEQAQRFATGVNHNEGLLKLTSSTWLEKFKQKNGIGSGKLTRRASETNIPDRSSLNPDSAGPSASQTPNGISPTSPNGLASPSTLSRTKSDDGLETDGVNYFAQGNGGYRHSNSHSTTSLSSAFTDTAPSPFSGGPTSPTTPFTFSPETNSGTWMPSQQTCIPPQSSNFQRPRSQTFPMLGSDPSFISPQGTEPITPKYLPATAPSSALDSPMHEMAPPFGMDATLSPQLHHSSSNGSMAPPISTTPISGLQSPPGSSVPSSPTPEDARRALDTLLSFFQQAPGGLVDQSDYLAVLKLTEKLRIQPHAPLPGGLHRIAEQDGEHCAPKMEQSMSAGC